MNQETTVTHQVICDYCGELAEVTSGKVIYPKLPKLSHLVIYACFPCDAYVGTHKNSGTPLGRLADKKLRTLKMKTHAAFDPLWKSGYMHRTEAYNWLAKRMGIKKHCCHIGMFNESQCTQAISMSKAMVKQINLDTK